MTTEPTNKPIKLLAVEDDPSLSFVLEEALAHAEAAEIEAVMVSDLANAEAQLNGQGPDDRFELILLDLTLPDSDGLDTFSAVHEKAADTPVVVLTGTEDPELEQKVREMGAEDFLLKGQIGSKALIRKVRAVTRGEVDPGDQPDHD